MKKLTIAAVLIMLATVSYGQVKNESEKEKLTNSIAKESTFRQLYELPSRKAITSITLTVVPDKSPFANFLIQRLYDNEETIMSSEELFSSFRMDVITNCDAIPQYGEISDTGDQGGNFVFLKSK